MKKLFFIIVLIIIIIFGLLFYFGKLDNLSMIVYGAMFGSLSAFNKKNTQAKNKHLEAIKESQKSMDSAMKIMEEIKTSRDNDVRELMKDVEATQKKVDNMSNDELIAWGNKFLEAKRRGKVDE